VTGVELYDEAVETAHQLAAETGLEARARLVRADASRPLPFGDDTFDAVLCVDAVNHAAGREAVFADWARLLRPGDDFYSRIP
jgi:SAM-dependent methyltransferase